MLTLAVLALSAAVVAGAMLALRHLQPDTQRRPLPGWMAIAHGAVGALGLGAMLIVLRGPPRGLGTGTASFGWTAAVLLTGALCAGLALPLLRRSRLLSPAVIVVHGAVAVTGYAIFLAWSAFD